jgi:acetyl-CoA carboxylase biotin carboxyl carrier protein
VTDVRAEMVANVWKVEVAAGQQVAAGDVLLVLESMKMEIPVLAEHAGTVRAVPAAAGTVVQEGHLLVVLD